jgi:hypothetical protein
MGGEGAGEGAGATTETADAVQASLGLDLPDDA